MPGLYRSVLYMPASNERAVEKAKSLPTDAVIFDLEDAVAPDAKPDARDRAAHAVGSGEYGDRTLTIRCNGLGTPWGRDDVLVAASVSPTAIVVPKVDNATEVDAVAAVLDEAGATSTTVWAMIETPAAVFAARSIASHPRVSMLVVGTNDLARELQAPLDVAGRANLVPHLANIVLAARAARTPIVDGVFNDIADTDGFAAECRQGVELGFDGKTLIHPSQIDLANDAWSPSAEEIAAAERIIAAFDEAAAAGQGVATVDGRMIENLHVDHARRTLAIANAVAAAQPAD